MNILDIPKTIPNNGYTAKAFSVARPRPWNTTLDDELRGCTKVELFKNEKLRHYCLSHFINANIVLTIVTYMYVYFLIFYCIPCRAVAWPKYAGGQCLMSKYRYQVLIPVLMLWIQVQVSLSNRNVYVRFPYTYK